MSKSHGLRNTPEYGIWRGIKKRCYLKTDQAYYLYGAVGVTMFEEWRNSFAAFLRDVGRRPSPLFSIDRFPNAHGNYEPGNVRWATDEEQNRNRGDYNVLVPLNGLIVTVAEWADATGKSRHLVYERLKRGWTPERAVSLALNESRKGQKRSPETIQRQAEARKDWWNRKRLVF